MDLAVLMTTSGLIALGMLTLMEIILGIDNIIFISIVSNKLKKEEQPKARNIGLFLAMILRIFLLFGITWITAMEDHKLFIVDTVDGTEYGPTGKSLILIIGGLFLLYKSVSEIHHKLEGHNPENDEKAGTATLGQIVFQICMLNVVFSFDSILTAVGLTADIPKDGQLIVMILGVILSMIIMMIFAGPVSRFVNNHPTIQVLGLAFLILIGFMLSLEGLEGVHPWAEKVHVPKGYMYFAIFFSLFVEFLNIRMKKKGKPLQLRGALEEAKERDIYNLDETN